CNAIAKDSNFKVRINAALAISVANGSIYHNSINDIDYGDSLPLVWKVLLDALSNPIECTDFKEYKYVKTLISQLRTTFYHVIHVTSKEENFKLVKDLLCKKSEIIYKILYEALKSHITQVNYYF